MVRDTEDGKVDYTLVLDGPMFERWAEHLTKGARKYAARNWMKATGTEEYDRFRRSLLRHLFAFLRGETDEDHAAAIFFNVNGMEYVRDQMETEPAGPAPFKLGDRVLVISGSYAGDTGTIVAPTTDGPFDWFVSLDRLNMDRAHRESELEHVG